MNKQEKIDFYNIVKQALTRLNPKIFTPCKDLTEEKIKELVDKRIEELRS